MKTKILRQELNEEELNTLCMITIALKALTFDQQWHIINYIVVRLWGRSWTLAKPASDPK